MSVNRVSLMLGAVVALALVGNTASGAVIVHSVTDLIGDKDGFGIGATNGNSFDWTAVSPTGDGDGTDAWMFGTQTWTHTYNIGSLVGTMFSANLEILHGGVGIYGIATIKLNEVQIGTLTNGDTIQTGSMARLNSFDLMPHVALLSGEDDILVTLAGGGDGWVLDYSELTLVSHETIPDPPPTGQVPEPSTIAIWSLLGLIGFAFSRRRKR